MKKNILFSIIILFVLSSFASAQTYSPTYSTKLIFKSGANKLTIMPPALSGDFMLTLPDNDGTPNQVLQTDGSGGLSWYTIPTTPSGWFLGGNTSPSSNILGTLSADDILIQANGVTQLTVRSAGGMNIPATTSAGVGVIYMDGSRFIHNIGTTNFFAGKDAGNLAADVCYDNVGIGIESLSSLMNAHSNTAVGAYSLAKNTTGLGGVAIGDYTLYYQDFDNGGGQWFSDNTAVGHQALYLTNSTNGVNGTSNTGIGANALAYNTTGAQNTAVGTTSLHNNGGGNYNTALGYEAMRQNNFASENTAVGHSALYSQSFGNSGTVYSSYNTAIGNRSLYNNGPSSTTDGINNTAIGFESGLANTTGTSNTYLGSRADGSAGTFINSTAIGANAIVNASNKIQLGDGNVTRVSTSGNLSIRNLNYVWPTGFGAGVLTSDGSGNLSWASAPTGLTHFIEAINTTSPNATVPVVSLTATNAATNVDAAFMPKGSGAFLVDIPDGTAAGGNKRGTYAVDLQLYRNAATMVASGDYSTIGGGYDNTASAISSTISGGSGNRAIGNSGSTVGGGNNNRANNDYSTVGGGSGNTAGGISSTIDGGANNTASGNYSAIGGGYTNIASNLYSTVGGGGTNTASGNLSTVSGGSDNTASGSYSAVGGGDHNTAGGDYSAIAGGRGLTLDTDADGSFGFLGGNTGSNNMTISAANTAVFGNTDLWLANNDNSASELRFYGAQSTNGAFPLAATKYTAFKAQTQLVDVTYTLPSNGGLPGYVLSTTGGVTPTLSWEAMVEPGWSLTGNTGTTAGTNFIGTTDNEAFEIHIYETDAVDKGSKRVMRFEPKYISPNIIGGYQGNGVLDGEDGSTIAGGGSSLYPNIINSTNGFIGGGFGNTIAPLSSSSVVVGGGSNTAGSFKTFVGGGDGNTAGGFYSVIVGGQNNTTVADYSAIPGGNGLTLSGIGSFGFLGGNTGSNNMTISTANTAVLGNVDMWLGNNDGSTQADASQLRFYEPNAIPDAFPSGVTHNYAALRAPASLGADYVLTLPVDDGTANQVLQTDGSGVLSWGNVGGGVTSITGTANQVLANGTSGSAQTGAVTLTLPQSISTTSNPTFATMTVSNLTPSKNVKAGAGGILTTANIDLASDVDGTLPVINGGTGLDASGVGNGQILIGNDAIDGFALTNIVGTANRVTVANGPGTITLSGPQDLGVTSTPTFATVNLASVDANRFVVTDGSGNLSAGPTLGTIGSLASSLTGQVGVANGGTGIDASTVSNGQILIGHDANNNFSLASLSAGSGISITPGAGSITIAAIGGGGGWALTGNTLTGTLPATPTEFFGSTNGADVVMKANNTEQMRLRSAGGINIPTTTAAGVGVIFQNGDRMIHSKAGHSFFAGYLSGNLTMSGGTNTGIGAEALQGITNGSHNTGVGTQSLYQIQSGSSNTAVGGYSLSSTTTGGNNTAVGQGALINNISGGYNTGIGQDVLRNTTGYNNSAIGYRSGYTNTSGTSNTYLGDRADASANNFSNSTAVGAFAQVGASDVIVLGAINTVNDAPADAKVGIGTTAPTEKLEIKSGNVLLSNAGTAGTLGFQGTGTGVSTFAAGAQGTTTISYTLPTTQPMASQVLTATAVSGSGPYNVTLGWTMGGITYLKTADESVNNSGGAGTTFQDDDHLAGIPVGNSEIWAFDGFLLYTSPSVTPNIKLQFVTSQNATISSYWTWGGPAFVTATGESSVTVGTTSTTITADYNVTPAVGSIHVKGTIVNASGSAATLKLQWAQSAASASNATLLAGSYLTFSRVK
jgi:hypothetical protein